MLTLPSAAPLHQTDTPRPWRWSQHWRDVFFAHWRIPVGVMENVQGRQRGGGHQAIGDEQTQANNNGEKCDASHYNFISCLVAAPERPAIMEGSG